MNDDPELLDWFMRYYEPAKRHNQGMEDNWAEFEQAYLGDPDGSKPAGEQSWRSWIHFKYGYQQVQTLAAELAADDIPMFIFEGRNPEQDSYAKTAQEIIGYQLQRDDYATKRLLATINAAVYGGQPLKVHWNYQQVSRYVLKPNGLHEEIELVLCDQPTITLIDPRDFYYDPRATSMDECRYVFHRMRLSYEELASRKKADGSPLYDNLDMVKEYHASSDHPNRRELDNDYAGERDKARREGIEVVEMWTKERLLVVACGHYIIRDIPNPYMHGRIPFEVATLQPSLNDVWGLSVMWAIRDIQELLWTLDNASMDSLKFQIKPMLSVDVNGDPANAQRIVRPGQVYPGKGDARQIVATIPVAGIDPMTANAAIEAGRSQMEYVTGITREMAGQSQADTATQAALNQRQSKGRVGIMLRSIDAAFASCAEMMLQLNQQYLDLSKPVRLLGPRGNEWRHIRPAEIAGMWDVRPKNSSERVVKELQRQNLMEILGTLMPIASGYTTPTGKVLDLTPIISDLADSFDVHIDALLVPMDMQLQVQGKQAVAQAEQQKMMSDIAPEMGGAQGAPEPTPPPEQPENTIQIAQAKLFQSANYKDLPDKAQAAMLEAMGLPSDGVEDDNRNPTRPNAGVQNPLVSGGKAGSAAKKSASK